MDSRPFTMRCAVVGRGRMGSVLSARLGLDAPLGRGAVAAGTEAVPLAVPDGEIAAAAAAVSPGPLVGHLSGATTLEPLAPHEAFSLHPLMTVTGAETSFAGAAAAVAGASERSLTVARRLAELLGLRPVEVAEADRAAYHAAASIAANFLVALEGAAERLAATPRVDRTALAPPLPAAPDNRAPGGSQ